MAFEESAEYRLHPSHEFRIGTYCWYNTLACDVEQISVEETWEPHEGGAEQRVLRQCSQFSDWLRTAKLSAMMVCRQVRNFNSFRETSSVVSFFCSLPPRGVPSLSPSGGPLLRVVHLPPPPSPGVSQLRFAPLQVNLNLSTPPLPHPPGGLPPSGPPRGWSPPSSGWSPPSSRGSLPLLGGSPPTPERSVPLPPWGVLPLPRSVTSLSSGCSLLSSGGSLSRSPSPSGCPLPRGVPLSSRCFSLSPLGVLHDEQIPELFAHVLVHRYTWLPRIGVRCQLCVFRHLADLEITTYT